MKVFLDTNILLDIMMDSRENHIDSTSVLRVADAGYLQAVITTQSILDANYVLVNVAKTPLEDFITSLNEIMSVAKVESIDEPNIEEAIKSPNLDFEDAAQIACSVSCGCDCIISSDIRMKRDSTLTVYTPKEFCDMIFTPRR